MWAYTGGYDVRDVNSYMRIPTGRYTILSVDEGSDNPSVDLVRINDFYGDINLDPSDYSQFKIRRKSLSTVRGWSFVKENGPEIKVRPYVAHCSVCGNKATVIESVVPVNSWRCENCRPAA